MITINFDPNAYKLEVIGHAGSAPKGQDLVCAAVSILVTSLASSVTEYREMMSEEPLIGITEGYALIECKPRHENRRLVSFMYVTILHGLHFLAEQYPEYVSWAGIENRSLDDISSNHKDS